MVNTASTPSSEKRSLEGGPIQPSSNIVEAGDELRISEQQRQGALAGGPPDFHISQLWRAPLINPINAKAYTIPVLTLNNPYSRNFHLSWLGFLVAFLSWFAFPPLIPEAIKEDLKLTPVQIANSNIVALCATLIVRLVTGPLIDRFGPRLVMGWLLVLGAIPSGLAGTVTSVHGLYVVRFFIGILGGTFVPCQAWTTAFFDKSVVGIANALVGGWGNAGGGITFVVMVALYQQLLSDGLSPHSAWRAAFAIIPVPILLGTALLTFLFGTDHPAGKWSQRHNTPAAALAIAQGHKVHLDHGEAKMQQAKLDEKVQGKSAVVEAPEEEDAFATPIKSETDTAVNESLTLKTAIVIATSPLTWLPGLSYMTSFGLELAIDANLATILFNLYHPTDPSFGQTRAGYFTSLFGLLNIFTRPFGGYLGDKVYVKYGVPGKKWLTLGLSVGMGAVTVGLGKYIENHVEAKTHPSLGAVMGLITIIAIFCEMANGANFSLVPHCNPYSNGVMSGIVGAMGNLGGIFFALVFRYQPTPSGKPLWIMGVVCILANVIVCWVRVPKW